MLPDEITAECLVTLAAGLEIDTPEDTRRPLSTAQAVDDGEVRDLIWHFTLSPGSREYRQHQAVLVPRQRPDAGRHAGPSPRMRQPGASVAVRRNCE